MQTTTISPKSDFKSIFRQLISKVSASLAKVRPKVKTKDKSIRAKTETLRACVVDRFPAQDGHTERLVMGGLAVYRMRTADLRDVDYGDYGGRRSHASTQREM